MLGVADVFNSSGVFGIWLSQTTLNFTGDYSMTFIFALLGLLMLLSIFRLPDLLLVLFLVAPIVLISTITEVGGTFNLFVGLIILYFALVIWSLFPGK